MSYLSRWYIGSVIGGFIVASIVAFSLLLGQPTKACAAGLQVPCGNARLEGKVSAADTGDGLASALLSIVSTSSASFAISVNANADGTYQVDIPVAIVGQSFIVSAYPSFPNPRYLNSDEAVALELISGTTTSLNFALDVGGSIEGKVEAAQSGQPLTQTIVTALRYDTEFEEYLVVSSQTVDASGGYKFIGLKSGAYVLRYQPKGSNAQYMLLYNDNAYALEDAIPITVTAPSLVEKEITIGIGALIEGYILRADTNLPVQGATAHLQDLQANTLSLVTSDSSGRYLFSGVAPGQYRVIADPSAFQTLPQDHDLLAAFYGDTREKAQADVVTVTAANVDNPGNPVTNINVHLPVGATIRGTVRDAVTNAPIPDVSIHISQTLSGDLPHSALTILTNASGVYTATGLEAGPAQVLFVPPLPLGQDYLFQVYPLQDVHPFQSGGDLLDLELGEIVSAIDGALNKTSRISGRVVDPQGKPLSNIAVRVEEVDNATFAYETVTNANGEYERIILPGDYQVRFSRNIICGCYNRQYYATEANPSQPATLTVGALATVAGIDTSLECGVAPPIAEVGEALFMPKLTRP